jgi:hypothetical protein
MHSVVTYVKEIVLRNKSSFPASLRVLSKPRLPAIVTHAALAGRHGRGKEESVEFTGIHQLELESQGHSASGLGAILRVPRGGSWDDD